MYVYYNFNTTVKIQNVILSCCVVLVGTCPIPDGIVDGSVSFLGQLPGDIAVYSCDDDFLLVGQNTTTCRAVDVTWDNPPPLCHASGYYDFQHHFKY